MNEFSFHSLTEDELRNALRVKAALEMLENEEFVWTVRHSPSFSSATIFYCRRKGRIVAEVWVTSYTDIDDGSYCVAHLNARQETEKFKSILEAKNWVEQTIKALEEESE